MFDGSPDTAQPTTRAAEPGSFRARLLARQALRPQSTLAIDSGIVYRPGSSDTASGRRAAEKVRDEIRRRRAEAEAATRPAPVVAAAPQPEPAPPVASDEELKSAIEAVIARKTEETAHQDEIAPAPAVVPMVAPQAEAAPDIRPAVAEAEEQVDVSTRIGDISQIAFAGLAILGLAGLSVMAAQNALDKQKEPVGAGSDTDVTGDASEVGPALKGGASAAALATAAPAEPQAWFNYQGVADMLAARKAEMEAAERAAAEQAEQEARLQAANAIAEAEAARVAEEQQAAAAAAEQARLDEEAERQRLAEAEAARVAQAEADRQARLEAERQAAAEAEAQRLADLEARRQAEAEAETRRLAQLDAERLAQLKAEREAAEQAARREAFEKAKAEAAERLHLDTLKAQAEADAAETARLQKVAAEAEADRIAAEKLAAERLAAQKAAAAKLDVPAVPAAVQPQKIVFAPYQGPVPVPASYKPAKPAVMVRASSNTVREQTVTRAAPASLKPARASVRAFETPESPRTPEAFLASRAERTASAPMATDDLQMVQQAFRSILDKGIDGSAQSILVPDGRTISIVLERTVSREMGQSTVRTVTYTPGVNEVTRVVTEQAPVTVSVMCRDVAYAFAGQEHGRFAACQAPDGSWTLARATDTVRVQTASLPNSAS